MSRALRLAKILRIVGRYRLDEFVDHERLSTLPRVALGLAPWRLQRTPDLPRGVRLRRALEELGPVFIKFGQMLSTRRDLLPEDIADELAKLQDDVPPFPQQQSIAIIEKALGKPVAVLFASFESTPMASASVAQVHGATLHSGERVVVKVVRPDIEPVIRQDIALLFTLARLAEKYHPNGRRLRPVEVVSDYELVILDELDMGREAANACQLRRNFENNKLLYIPAVYWEYTCRNVLTMERIAGIPVTDLETLRARGTDLKLLGERGVDIFFTQVFHHSFFHADIIRATSLWMRQTLRTRPTSPWTAPSLAASRTRTSITSAAICWVSFAATTVKWRNCMLNVAGCHPTPAYRTLSRPCAPCVSLYSNDLSAKYPSANCWCTCSRPPAALTWRYNPRWYCCKKPC